MIRELRATLMMTDGFAQRHNSTRKNSHRSRVQSANGIINPIEVGRIKSTQRNVLTRESSRNRPDLSAVMKNNHQPSPPSNGNETKAQTSLHTGDRYNNFLEEGDKSAGPYKKSKSQLKSYNSPQTQKLLSFRS